MLQTNLSPGRGWLRGLSDHTTALSLVLESCLRNIQTIPQAPLYLGKRLAYLLPGRKREERLRSSCVSGDHTVKPTRCCELGERREKTLMMRGEGERERKKERRREERKKERERERMRESKREREI
ncbi:hypothetical protein WMY93_031488 [Mugilogobius chulae]|uniref:Uncharacterized protein n=1 Tax=Mugilogobius chulae TaxID=88201 RepID=A0AAW0MMW6_9GOBI